MPKSSRRRLAAALLALALGLPTSAARAEDLMDLYLRAVTFDPAFQKARLERLAAWETLGESRANLRPEIKASAEASRVFQNIMQGTGFIFQEGKTPFYNSGYSISLTQPIFHLETSARIPQARAEVRQAEAQYAAAEQDLIFRVAQAHFNFLAAREDVGFAGAERQAIAAQLREAEERLGSGLATIADVQDSRGRHALALAAEVEAEDALEEARQAIAEITGEAPAEVGLLSGSFPLVRPDREDVEVWVEAALFQNPRVQALQAAVEVARLEVRRQRGGYSPGLDLVATHGYSNNGGSTFGGGNEIENTEIGVRLTVPFYDSGRTAARVQGAALRRNIYMQELERERRRIEREARAAYQGVVSGITRVQSLDQSVFSHEAALSVKEEGWRAGVNTGLIVLDARKELFSARRDLAHARYLYILNSLKLKQTAGTLGAQDLRQINAYLQ